MLESEIGDLESAWILCCNNLPSCVCFFLSDFSFGSLSSESVLINFFFGSVIGLVFFVRWDHCESKRASKEEKKKANAK